MMSEIWKGRESIELLIAPIRPMGSFIVGIPDFFRAVPVIEIIRCGKVCNQVTMRSCWSNLLSIT